MSHPISKIGGQLKGVVSIGQFRVPSQPLQGITLATIGLTLWLISRRQPAWFGSDIGPGLLAQYLALAVLGIGLVWTLLGWAKPQSTQTHRRQPITKAVVAARPPLLLASVCAFVIALPVTGLVPAAGLAAAMATLGAGERRWWFILLTGVLLMAMTALIGILLLPPATQLWPFS
ncbi:MAG: tripartite tricarboxylate transporter TctB family protein [Saccharospirillum sp.]